MNILAFAASSSRTSINKALVTFAAGRLEGGLVPGARVEIIDLNDYEPPLYSIDRQNEGGIAEAAQRFFDKIAAADGVMLSTSNGSRGGRRVLDTATSTAPYVGADLLASLSVPHFGDNFDPTRGELTDPDLVAELEAALVTFGTQP